MTHSIQLQQLHHVLAEPNSQLDYVLIDRLWPRGVRKADLESIVHWYKDAAPSPELRKALHDGSLSDAKFRQAYARQLKDDAESLTPLLEKARTGTLCLVTATKNPDSSYLVVLRDALLSSLKAE